MKIGFKKIICGAMALLTVFSFVGCKKPIGGTVIGKIDKTKTELKVFSYNGGVGSEWLDKIIKRFEEDYKDVSFEEGKKGVVITPDKTKGNIFSSPLKNNDNHIIFSEIADYTKLVNDNELLDITDVMTKPLNEVTKTTDTKTIKSKMYDETIDYYTTEGKMYAIPHYSFFSTLTYNKQLLTDKNLYFAKDYNVNETNNLKKFISNKNAAKSCGPDGQPGTDDDGLPATWEEMFILFDTMKSRGVTPLAWAGGEVNNGGYINYMLNAIYLSLAGKEQAMLNYTFDSKGKKIKIVEGSGLEVKEEVITPENYKKMNSEYAKYQAIQVVDRILDTPTWADEDCVTDTTTMLGCQRIYLDSQSSGTPIAIIAEGSYWCNEADNANYFTNARNNDAEYDEKIDFQIMPLPRLYNGTYKDVQGKDMNKSVYADQADSIAAINGKIKNNASLVKLATTFLAYCYTDEALREFTETTRVTRSLKYDIDENKLDDWAKAVWTYTSSSDLLLPYSRAQQFLNNKKNLSLHIANNFWKAEEKTVYGSCKGSGTAADFFKKYMSR